MFFILSKTLGNALAPVNFLIGLGVLGAILSATRLSSLGRGLMITAAVLLVVAAFSPAGRLLLYPLESRFPPWDPGQRAPDGIIVLGGSIDPDLSVAHQTPIVRHAADRLLAPAELARRYPKARVVFTGGSANVVSNDAREADWAGTVLENIGIAKDRLIMERNSRNTFENALFTKQLVAPKPGERWLLVTSAYHMPRSMGIFRKAGFDVEAYPVDWRMSGRDDLFSFTNVGTDGFGRTEVAVREWIGLLAYRLRGRTGELLPGPAKD